MLEHVRKALCDKSPDIRKRAQHVLELATQVPEGGAGGGGAGGWGQLVEVVGWGPEEWQCYLAMLDAADNSAIHLIVELWPQWLLLLPPPRPAEGCSGAQVFPREP